MLYIRDFGYYLDVEKQRHGERRWHGHHLFGGQSVEVDDDDRAADLSFFFHQRGHLDQVEDLEQLFAGQRFRVPGRWKWPKKCKYSNTKRWFAGASTSTSGIVGASIWARCPSRRKVVYFDAVFENIFS